MATSASQRGTHMQKTERRLRLCAIRRVIGWASRLLGLVALTLVSLGQPGLAASCGPGPGWVSQCQPSVNTLPTTTVLDVSINSPTGLVHFPNLLLSGLTTTQSGAPRVSPGDRTFLELLISRHVSAMLPNGSAITVDTTGTAIVIEQVPGSALADSFFDVFFDLTLNHQPLQTTALHGVPDRALTQLPLNLPQASEPTPSGCAPASAAVTVAFCLVEPGHPVHVLDANNRPVVTINSARLDVAAVPEPATLYLVGSVVAGLMGYTVRRQRTPARAKPGVICPMEPTTR